MPSNEQPTPRKKPLRFGPSLNAESSPSSSPAPVVSASTPVPPVAKTSALPAYEFLGYLPDSYGSKKLRRP